ncbi:MAG: hypothetical protein RI563_08235 [Thiohalophilus sp.]|uniref:hypothetical protein n=1 Tax=Thiohalophilus sp. TaxID=3028392 RepID=UPI00286FFC53|nr:hypothetical protein [Thiohalophilus sp.]MDR9436855.1 hypothetical protein [Thiohalophilus sp.]
MKINAGWIVLATVMLAGCDSRTHDPWVQNDDYLKEERSRSAQLDEQLDRRIQGQAER